MRSGRRGPPLGGTRARDLAVDVGGDRARRRSRPDRSGRRLAQPADVVSLNLAETGSIDLGSALLELGIGIEAGIFDLTDAGALLAAPWAGQVMRVLVETIFEHDDASAVELATAIDARVASLDRPRLWHGDDRATWAVVDAGLAAGHDARVGLEDSLVDRDGGPAPSNPDQVKRTLARRGGRR